ASKLDAGQVQVMYQVAVLGRRDLPLAPDEFAGFSMAVLRMLSFAGGSGAGETARRTAERAAPASAPRAAAPAAAPRASAPPARSPAPPPPTASERAPRAAPVITFDGDWPGLVQRLNLTGLAGMVARHGELESFE